MNYQVCHSMNSISCMCYRRKINFLHRQSSLEDLRNFIANELFSVFFFFFFTVPCSDTEIRPKHAHCYFNHFIILNETSAQDVCIIAVRQSNCPIVPFLFVCNSFLQTCSLISFNSAVWIHVHFSSTQNSEKGEVFSKNTM